jgi:hypothetical protein
VRCVNERDPATSPGPRGTLPHHGGAGEGDHAGGRGPNGEGTRPTSLRDRTPRNWIAGLAAGETFGHTFVVDAGLDGTLAAG